MFSCYDWYIIVIYHSVSIQFHVERSVYLVSIEKGLLAYWVYSLFCGSMISLSIFRLLRKGGNKLNIWLLTVLSICNIPVVFTVLCCRSGATNCEIYREGGSVTATQYQQSFQPMFRFQLHQLFVHCKRLLHLVA